MDKNKLFLKKCKRSLLLVIMLALVFFAQGCDKKDEEVLINTMSYNMKFESKTGGDPVYSWANRKPGIVKSLSDYNINIVGTQELETWQHTELLEALGDKWSSIGESRYTTSDEKSAILYRNDILTCVENSTIWLSETPTVRGSKSWGTAHPRILTYGKFKINSSGAEFYYFNTHLDHKSEEAREKGLELIVSYMENVKDYPIILTGDFNMYLDSASFKSLTSKSDTYLDTFSLFAPKFDVDGKTSHGFNGGTEGKAIDYIFYSIEGWELLETEIIRDRYENRFWLSDHYPVYSKFRLL